MKCRLSLFPNPIARGVIFYVDGELSASIAVGLMTIFQAVKEDRIRGARRIVEKYGATLVVYTGIIDDVANVAYIVNLFRSFFPRGRVIIETATGAYALSRVFDESGAYEVVDEHDAGCIDTHAIPVVLDMSHDELKSYLCKCMRELEEGIGCIIVVDRENTEKYIEAAKSCSVDIVCEPQMLIHIRVARGTYEVTTLDCDSL